MFLNNVELGSCHLRHILTHYLMYPCSKWILFYKFVIAAFTSFWRLSTFYNFASNFPFLRVNSPWTSGHCYEPRLVIRLANWSTCSISTRLFSHAGHSKLASFQIWSINRIIPSMRNIIEVLQPCMIPSWLDLIHAFLILAHWSILVFIVENIVANTINPISPWWTIL